MSKADGASVAFMPPMPFMLLIPPMLIWGMAGYSVGELDLLFGRPLGLYEYVCLFGAFCAICDVLSLLNVNSYGLAASSCWLSIGRVVVRGSRFLLLVGSLSWKPGGDVKPKSACVEEVGCCWANCCCFARFVEELLRDAARTGELWVLVGATLPDSGV